MWPWRARPPVDDGDDHQPVVSCGVCRERFESTVDWQQARRRFTVRGETCPHCGFTNLLRRTDYLQA